MHTNFLVKMSINFITRFLLFAVMTLNPLYAQDLNVSEHAMDCSLMNGEYSDVGKITKQTQDNKELMINDKRQPPKISIDVLRLTGSKSPHFKNARISINQKGNNSIVFSIHETDGSKNFDVDVPISCNNGIVKLEGEKYQPFHVEGTGMSGTQVISVELKLSEAKDSLIANVRLTQDSRMLWLFPSHIEEEDFLSFERIE